MGRMTTSIFATGPHGPAAGKTAPPRPEETWAANASGNVPPHLPVTWT